MTDRAAYADLLTKLDVKARWCRPMDVGGTSCNRVSDRLQALYKRRLVERRARPMNPKLWLYHINDAGRAFLDKTVTARPCEGCARYRDQPLPWCCRLGMSVEVARRQDVRCGATAKMYTVAPVAQREAAE